jgi:hypothetical protein
VVNNDKSQQTFLVKCSCYGLFILSTLLIFAIAQTIQFYLNYYNIGSMYVSFCAGFILFTPLVVLVLHPLIFVEKTTEEYSYFSVLIKNAGLVLLVQCLFFLIWMTDAIALYSIYVDQNSFLAEAFNINRANNADLSTEFFWFNLFLAWLFSLLSLVLGIMPCLFARIDNNGVVKNFVAGFSFAKKYKIKFALSAFAIAVATVIPLLYIKYLFLLSFPVVVARVFLYFSTLLLKQKEGS